MANRILLVHNYPIFLKALKDLVEGAGFTMAGEATGGDAIATAQRVQPDIAILDLELPSLEPARQILEASPGTRIIILTMRTEEYYVLEAIRLGVKGYVLKTKTAGELLQTIHEVSQGHTCFSPEVSRIALQPYFERNLRRSDRLTDRERQVVTLIAEGNSTKEVATRLGISVKTADCHRTRIMDKLNLHQTAHLVRYAIRQGFVQP